jgi:phosphatidate cytidylyltransferase
MLRAASAAVGIPIVLLINFLGGLPFAITIALAAAIGAFEFCRLMWHAGYRPSFLAAVPLSAIAAGLPMVVRHPERAWIGILMFLIAAGGAYYLSPHVFRAGLLGWVTTAIAVLYVGIMLGHLALLREISQGARWVIMVLLITWAYDTGAYFTGRSLGHRPFMHHVSPNKTLEGVVGGLLVSSVVGGLLAPLALGLQAWEGLALGFVLGAVAQTGDLVESMIKRQVEVKDSGALFPGHGGLLDRIDSLLFSGVAAYYAAIVLGHAT